MVKKESGVGTLFICDVCGKTFELFGEDSEDVSFCCFCGSEIDEQEAEQDEEENDDE